MQGEPVGYRIHGKTLPGCRVSDCGFEEPADICLINTCVVTNMGQSKSRKIIHRAARRDPKPLIVVTGCYPQTSPDEVVHIDGVDLIIGNQDRSKWWNWSGNGWEKARTKPHQCGPRPAGGTGIRRTGCGGGCQPEPGLPEDPGRVRPVLRLLYHPLCPGPSPFPILDNIREEVAKLTAEQYKEIVLIGIHLAATVRKSPAVPIFPMR